MSFSEFSLKTNLKLEIQGSQSHVILRFTLDDEPLFEHPMSLKVVMEKLIRGEVPADLFTRHFLSVVDQIEEIEEVEPYVYSKRLSSE